MINKLGAKVVADTVRKQAMKLDKEIQWVKDSYLQEQADLFFDTIFNRIILAAYLKQNKDVLLPVEAEPKVYIHLLRATEETLAYYEVDAPMVEDATEFDYPTLELQSQILAYKFKSLKAIEEIEKELKAQGYCSFLCPNSTLIKCHYFLKIYL